MEKIDIPWPIAVEKYNRYMGGVDKSDQSLSYHNVLRKTVRYWKTLFYHMIDIAAVNGFVLYNSLAHQANCRTITENEFCDALVLQIIESMDEIEGTLFLEVDHPHLAAKFAMEVPCTLSR